MQNNLLYILIDFAYNNQIFDLLYKLFDFETNYYQFSQDLLELWIEYVCKCNIFSELCTLIFKRTEYDPSKRDKTFRMSNIIETYKRFVNFRNQIQKQMERTSFIQVN
jgi:hypothetical protein